MMLFAALKIKSNYVKFTRPLYKLVRCMSKSVIENQKALVLYHEDEGIISITLKYINEDLRINKGFHFRRKSTEKCSYSLSVIGNKIKNCIDKKCSHKNNINPSLVKVDVISKTGDNSSIESLSCLDCFVNTNNYLKIGNYEYELEVNPPLITSIELPKNEILAGFMLYPSQLNGFNFNICDSNFKWYISRRKFESVNEEDFKTLSAYPQEWKEIGEGFQIFISKDHISRLIKVVVIPGKDELRGQQVQAISGNLVYEISESFPYEYRHQYTSHVLPKDFVRVVTYNILANIYARSNLAKTVLFRSCPPTALDIEHRKRLILKELIGYNADVICLQEVDHEIFHYDFKIIFSLYNLGGVFNNKGKKNNEGIATFYRKEKFNLLEEKCFKLSEELETNSLFKEFHETLKENEEFCEAFSNQVSILQMLILSRIDSPEKILIVGNTHLYAKIEADHIRLIQSWMSVRLLKDEVECLKIQNPELTVSLMLCGDFNSLPESAAYRLIGLQQHISPDDEVWNCNPNTTVKNISLSNDVGLTSACGTPSFTNYTIDFKGCLDYIFYERENFTVEQVVPLPSEDELKKHEALPSSVSPSDHIALVADLKWKY